jgi:glucarate dehydratase
LQVTATAARLISSQAKIRGKAVGKPICDVIGGRVRGGGLGDDLRGNEYGAVLYPDAAVREATQIIARYGFREIKLKDAVLPTDVEMSKY